MQKSVLIANDSIGSRLKPHITHWAKLLNCEHTIEYCIKPGATARRVALAAVDKLKMFPASVTLYQASVNNMTDHLGAYLEPKYNNIGDFVENLHEQQEEAYYIIKSYCPTVSMGDIIGLHVDTYNDLVLDTVTYYVDEQQIINKGVPILNDAQLAFNASHFVKAPYTAYHIFPNKAKTPRYNKLSDGIHPTIDTSSIWARQIVRNIMDQY